MSIVCKEAVDSRLKTFPGRSGYVWATIDSVTIDQMPLPSDYKYHSCLLPKRYTDWADRIQNFNVRPDDTYVCGFFKSGTTWLQNIVYQLKNELNFSLGFVLPNFHRVEEPIDVEKVEGDTELAKEVDKRGKEYAELDGLPSPRLMKSHLPAYLLPKAIWNVQPKVIYIYRDVKDVAVSFYHMIRNIEKNKHRAKLADDKNEFFSNFYNHRTHCSPFYQHIHSFYQLRHLKHVLLVSYEELSANTFESVKRISEFLECLYSDEQLEQLVQHVSFKKMRENVEFGPKNPDSDYKFCHKGKVGGHLDDMSEKDIKRFDKWTAKQKSELNLVSN